MSARFVVGIDLGTTNTAVAFVDTLGLDEGDLPEPRILEIPQLVAPGQVEERSALPSFIYLPAAAELAPGALELPWGGGRDYAVGEWARSRGAEVPARTVSSAKSWLRAEARLFGV